MRRLVLAVSAAALAVAIAAPASAQVATAVAPRVSERPPEKGTKWQVDPVHSQIDFKVRHLVGRVRGTFDEWNGVLVTKDKDWTHGTVNVRARTASINTGNRHRDADLKSERFFDVAKFPELTFESTGIVATDSTVEIGGILTIKGRAHQVTLKGNHLGIAKDPAGRERIAFEASTVVDRRDYGLMWSDIVDNTKVIGEDVTITIAIEAIRVPG